MATDVAYLTHGFDSTVYEALKSRIHSLKKEHVKVVRSQQDFKEVETVALLTQKAEYEDTILQLEDDLGGLQLQLRQNTERSAKLRLHYEKDKKTLQGQIEKLEKSLKGIEGIHNHQAAEVAAAHDAKVRELEVKMEEMQHQQVEERAALEKEKEAAIIDVDEWCKGEVEAFRHFSGKKIEAAEAEALEWKERHDKEMAQRKEAEAEIAETKNRLEEVSVSASSLEKQLEAAQQLSENSQIEWQSQRVQWEKERERVHATHASQVQALKNSHRQQLELIDRRLQQVLSKKDGTIAALKHEVNAVNEKLYELETLAC